MTSRRSVMKALVVGASGDNGGHLTRQLVQQGHWVRGLVRDPDRAITGLHEVVRGDVVTGHGLTEALTGIDVAFYFVHALDAADRNIDRRDTTAARRFVEAATAADLPRCIFLTTLAPPDGVDPPAYQRNRLAVEQILLDGIAGTTVVRAGMVAAPGSRGMLPYSRLVQRFPVIPLGPWRHNRVAVSDPDTVAAAMITAATDENLAGRILDALSCGEPTHAELIHAIAQQLRRRRLLVPIPFRTPRLDAALVSMVTGQRHSFSRYLLSVNENDYTTDPERSAPLSHLESRDLSSVLENALAEMRH
ncbi:NAD(P)H-binding protein [Nocardia sp. NPDC058176]|uniref:NAD(P)H-binding protein n=1 Tax=Nocardia sp. NPDC058176 TaxID=3346368 RepID=UPI0036D9C0B7